MSSHFSSLTAKIGAVFLFVSLLFAAGCWRVAGDIRQDEGKNKEHALRTIYVVIIKIVELPRR